MNNDLDNVDYVNDNNGDNKSDNDQLYSNN